MAGLHVHWGFDKDAAAIESYRLNFSRSNTEIHHCAIDQFAMLSAADAKVDILHLSPPCQTFSPAHTIDGKDDDSNSAAFLGVAKVVTTAQPRIVTFENTSGLSQRHRQWEHSTIYDFANLGFSVRWKLINCADYGAPQARRRFFMFASW